MAQGLITTYISITGRYCVLMPNTPRGGGAAEKSNITDRKRLKKIVDDLDVSNGMAVIIRQQVQKELKLKLKEIS